MWTCLLTDHWRMSTTLLLAISLEPRPLSLRSARPFSWKGLRIRDGMLNRPRATLSQSSSTLATGNRKFFWCRRIFELVVYNAECLSTAMYLFLLFMTCSVIVVLFDCCCWCDRERLDDWTQSCSNSLHRGRICNRCDGRFGAVDRFTHVFARAHS